jgi:hypothetical protein
MHGYKLVLLFIFAMYLWSFLKPKLEEHKKRTAPVVSVGLISDDARAPSHHACQTPKRSESPARGSRKNMLARLPRCRRSGETSFALGCIDCLASFVAVRI